MRAAQTLLLLCSLCPPCWLPTTRPPRGALTMTASASVATTSWKTVWVDEFDSEVRSTTNCQLRQNLQVPTKWSETRCMRLDQLSDFLHYLSGLLL